MASVAQAEIAWRPGTTGFDRKSQSYTAARNRRLARQAAFDAICQSGHAPETARAWLRFAELHGRAGHSTCLVSYSHRYPGMFLVKITATL